MSLNRVLTADADNDDTSTLIAADGNGISFFSPAATSTRVAVAADGGKAKKPPRRCAGLTFYEWVVLGSAWLGMGFDMFDSVLMLFVAPVFVPYLLNIDPNDQQSINSQVGLWSAIYSSILIFGWATGGIVFGYFTDKLGRSRTLIITILTYSIATAICALAPNLYFICVFRFIASLGIGGEIAAVMSLAKEALPPKRRAPASAFMLTSSPIANFTAMLLTYFLTEGIAPLANRTWLSWRLVFLCGLVPCGLAFIVRLKLKEPEVWVQNQQSDAPKGNPFKHICGSKLYARKTFSAVTLVALANITWWCINTFMPITCQYMATARYPDMPQPDLGAKQSEYQFYGISFLQLGSLIGYLGAMPVADRIGRLWLMRFSFLGSAVFTFVTFFIKSMPDAARFALFVPTGFFGTFSFSVFVYWLPELYPTQMRGTGIGFTYNVGRYITTAFPFVVGILLRQGFDPLFGLSLVGIVPAIAFIFLCLPIAGKREREREGQV
eukprot:GEZU01026335.1.p1 GENE.GEZU01026335.1~~GEZU01026335.1.p1  ORF type:complete len:495 (-),score=88.43 GEZU01026335.1:797-2281(-)